MLIEQILLNLGTNARDAMPTGGFLTISTEEAVLDEQAAQTHGLAKGPHAKVIVRDTGSGMSAATKARIFDSRRRRSVRALGWASPPSSR